MRLAQSRLRELAIIATCVRAYVAVQKIQGRPAVTTTRQTRMDQMGYRPMSAPIAKDQLAFQLPNLTYVDAHFEEPNLDRVTLPTELPKPTFSRWLAARVAAFHAWREKRIALAELEMMSDRDLQDIGLSRADLHRVFDSAHNADLVARSEG